MHFLIQCDPQSFHIIRQREDGYIILHIGVNRCEWQREDGYIVLHTGVNRCECIWLEETGPTWPCPVPLRVEGGHFLRNPATYL